MRTTAIKCKQNPENYTIRGFLETWKMEYLVSPIPDCSKPQSWEGGDYENWGAH